MLSNRGPFPNLTALSWAVIGLFAAATVESSLAQVNNDGQGSNAKILRRYADGSGPSAIFRLGRDETRNVDVFGVVDPVQWRIQFFTLEDWSPESGKPLSDRLRPAADCLLPPSFRVWRVHDFKDRIVLSSQPDVSQTSLYGNKPFAHNKITLDKSRENILAMSSGSETPTNSVPELRCGGIKSFASEQLPAFVPQRDVATKVAGGMDRDFVISPRLPAAGTAPFLRNSIILPARSRFLVSAQELETARSVKSR